ncbi:MAG: L,D-transpeptidase family protein [Chitinophagales bacterium]
MFYRILYISTMILMLGCKNTSHQTESTKMDETSLSFTALAPESTQIIVVQTADWHEIHGKMQLWEKTAKGWNRVNEFNILVGRNGMAWDNTSSLKNQLAGPIKKEGDGCSPAGVFSLDKIFSYHQTDNLNMPFIQVDENDLCVDDINSKYYNLLINDSTITDKDYHSFEHMLRDDLQYEYGVWVNYNTNPQIAGNGSCIFLHIYKDENTPTSGCTAMAKKDMLALINWLNSSAQPRLIQLLASIQLQSN